MNVEFQPIAACWICGCTELRPVHSAIFELSTYGKEDADLAAYTDSRVSIQRCAACGFAQPEALPALSGFFARMYDQRWSQDWIEHEFVSESKIEIFERVISGLEQRLPRDRRTLLDVGTHVGQFLAVARDRGWRVEGIELNPATAAYARRRTGATIHADDLKTLSARTPAPRFDAVTFTDVLEHIPEPLDTLRAAARLVRAGGWVAVKVPCGPNQLRKERVRVLLRRAERASVADNLVHVSHFTARSLRMALERCGFESIEMEVGRPERSLAPRLRTRLAANAIRRVMFAAARALPISSPLAFNLQAFARRQENGA